MKTKTNTRSVVPTSLPAAVGSGFTLGLDLGDRQPHVCVLDAAVLNFQFPRREPAGGKAVVPGGETI